MAEINKEKDVYLFLHGRMDLKQKSINALVSNGVSKDKIILALPNKVGNEGDYMAMLWMPPNPDHIKIQKITKVEQVVPEGMIGLWKGVSKDDLSTISLWKLIKRNFLDYFIFYYEVYTSNKIDFRYHFVDLSTYIIFNSKLVLSNY